MTDFLYQRIDFERSPQLAGRKHEFRLDRMRELLRRLGNPQDQYPVIHVAGTKGKGSTSSMIASILTAAGYTTGLYTSPHLERIEERIRCDLQPIPANEFQELLAIVQPVVQALDAELANGLGGPTFFEITTAMAMLCFARRRVQVAVLEVGLGGRLDSTNVVQPILSLITTISFDHTKQLGRTLGAIAREKAGIIKPGVQLISGVIPTEPRQVIQQIAASNSCKLWQLDRDFHSCYHAATNATDVTQNPTINFRGHLAGQQVELNQVELNLWGRHQADNAGLALAAVKWLQNQGWQIPESAIRSALATLQWPARIERVSQQPVVILDAAHNVASIAALLETIREQFPGRKRWVIFATSKDKPVSAMLRQLWPGTDELILTQYHNNPRAVPVEQLEKLANAVGQAALSNAPAGRRQKASARQGLDVYKLFHAPRVTAFDQVNAAWEYAKKQIGSQDILLIVGSFFLAAEIRPFLISGNELA